MAVHKFKYTEEMLLTRIIDGMKEELQSQEELAQTKIEKMKKTHEEIYQKKYSIKIVDRTQLSQSEHLKQKHNCKRKKRKTEKKKRTLNLAKRLSTMKISKKLKTIFYDKGLCDYFLGKKSTFESTFNA